MTLATSNPLVQPWNTPHGLPPFAEVRAEHFNPAFDAALSEHLADIEAIASSSEPPSFENTVAAFDRSGRLLARVEDWWIGTDFACDEGALRDKLREVLRDDA